MKASTSLLWLASVSSATAFCPLQQARLQSALQASHTSNEVPLWGATVTMALGWTLAVQVAMATPIADSRILQQSSISSSPTSTLLSGLPTFTAEPAPTYDKLDFSLPSYDSSSYGFGQGTELREEKTGGTEADKQAEAMKKAEEARKVRLAEKRAALKQQEAAEKQRAKLKQAEGQERVKALFGSE